MPRPQGSTRAALCLALLLPLALPVLAEDAPVPTDAAATPANEQPASEPGPPRPATGERSQDEATALARQLPVAGQQQLNAGNETFLALWQPANVGAPSGLVILLPGDGESADWPQAIGPLRHKLPNAGWHSLSLSLPDPNEPPPPEVLPLAIHNPEPEPVPDTTTENPEEASAQATAPAEPEASPDAAAAPAAQTPQDSAAADTQATAVPAAPPLLTPEEQRKAHTERVLARIEAGIAFAEQQQAKTVVLLGHGSGAYWAAQYLAERKPAQVKHLLLVAAALPAGFSPPLDELVPGLQLPTGDFFYKDQPADRSAAVKRAQAGKRLKHPAYVQVAMKALPGNPEAEQEQLYRRIRGWLTLQLKSAP
ncbi:MAG: alpha/beta hydrolase family protein [Pseudomonadota bacterium]